jgi:hypothetical protein
VAAVGALPRMADLLLVEEVEEVLLKGVEVFERWEAPEAAKVGDE